MKEGALTFLACPTCGGRLDCEVFEADREIRDGLLWCERCVARYPVISYVPRMVPSSFYAEAAIAFDRRYAGRPSARLQPAELPPAAGGHRAATATSFGFEWQQFSRFGWDDPTYDRDRERRTFLRKSLFRPEELAGRLVLDAGCGNGRYAYQAARHGAEVVGMDLSVSVDAARANTEGDPRIHIVQGDILRPPFRPEVFDSIFSIGVLMHTGDPAGAIKALAGCLAPRGSMAVRVYHRGNPVYETLDHLLRRWSTRQPRDKLLAFAERSARVATTLERLKLLRLLNQFVRLEAHPHCVFDWYSAPVATHHTYPEVRRWFLEAGLVPTADHQKGGRLRGRLFPPKGLTVRACKMVGPASGSAGLEAGQ
jgi:SAM-dependent methyltransferase/uncharacterized protein YbaR (Trm112 family)